jgi:UPF0716 protein FxsA
MPLVLLFLFLLLPIAELYVIIQVGQAIGLAPTLLLLILDGLAGAALARSQGRNAWARFNSAIAEGRVPGRETLDGAMIVLGGALLLAPGFITDIVGFSLLIPPTRALLRGLVTRLARRRVNLAWTVAGPPPPPRPGPGSNGHGGAPPRGYDFEGTAHEVTDPPPEIEEHGNP